MIEVSADGKFCAVSTVHSGNKSGESLCQKSIMLLEISNSKQKDSSSRISLISRKEFEEG
jgi:hypothetical protein